MDRDNPFSTSYIREGATRVQKPRLTYRQTEAPVKRPQPHLKLQRRLSNTSDVSAASNKPAIAEEDSGKETAMDNNATSVRSGSTARRNRSRVVRPADHSRPTVHFSGRPEILFTPPGGFPELPTAPTSTALSSRPKRNSAPIFPQERASFMIQPPLPLESNTVYSGDYFTIRQPLYSSVYGSTAGSVSTNKKTVTFDSSETEDTSSCLSTSTQATSVEPDYDYIPPLPKKSAASTSTAVQPTRQRSRSFSSIDRELLREEVDFLQLPRRASRSTSNKSQLSRREPHAIEEVPSSVISSVSQDNNSRAEFEARQVALEAQFEQRQQTLEAQQTKLADNLKETAASLSAMKQEKDSLHREHTEYIQRVQALEQENDDLRAELDGQQQAKESLERDLQQSLDATGQLGADLDTTSRGLSEANHALTEANLSLAEANKALAEVRLALAEEENKATLFRECKDAFEERCKDLEEQLVTARDAKKELHVLMASQIEDLSKTKDALQARIETLEQEQADNKKETDELLASRDQLMAEKEQSAAELEALTKEKATFDETVQELKGSVETLLKEKQDMEDRCILLDEEKTTASSSLETLQAEKEEWAAKFTDLQDREAELQTKFESLEYEIAAKATDIDTATRSLTSLQEENGALKEQASSHDAELEKWRQEAEDAAAELASSIAKLEGENAALTAEYEQLKASTISPERDVDGDNDNDNDNDNDTELKQKHAKLEEEYGGLQAQHAALEEERKALQEKHDALEAEHETLASQHDKAAEAQTEAQTRASQLEQHLADLAPFREQHSQLSRELEGATEQVDELKAAYAASEAEVMALQDQLAKVRSKLAGGAPSSTTSGSSSTKKSKKSKDELVIVRNPTDRGRFQVMKKSEFYSSRSPSRSSHKTDYDSA